MGEIKFPSLSSMKTSKVSFPFSEEEMEEVVFFADGSKCSSLDGFNFSFLNFSFFGVIKVDVKGMFNEFFVNAKLPKKKLSFLRCCVNSKGCKSTFVG